jgi:hypothetical protein
MLYLHEVIPGVEVVELATTPDVMVEKVVPPVVSVPVPPLVVFPVLTVVPVLAVFPLLPVDPVVPVITVPVVTGAMPTGTENLSAINCFTVWSPCSGTRSIVLEEPVIIRISPVFVNLDSRCVEEALGGE